LSLGLEDDLQFEGGSMWYFPSWAFRVLAALSGKGKLEVPGWAQSPRRWQRMRRSGRV